MGKRKKGIHFAPIFKDVVARPEWRKLSHSSQLIYIYLKLGYTGANNGQITMPYSTIEDMFSSSTISKALQELVSSGWIEKTDPGGLFRRSTRFRLTLIVDKVFKG